MLRLISAVKGYVVTASDGDVGRVSDLYFDDRTHKLRYVVVKLGGWLTAREVAILPISISKIDSDSGHIEVALTKLQVERSIDANLRLPVSKQMESKVSTVNIWNYHWRSEAIPPVAPFEGPIRPPYEAYFEPKPEGRHDDPHLYSAFELKGYGASAIGGDLGVMRDIVFDDSNWSLRYLVFDKTKFLPGGWFLIPISLMRSISWSKKSIAVDLGKEFLRRAPGFDRYSMITREYEKSIYAYFGLRPYWEEETPSMAA